MFPWKVASHCPDLVNLLLEIMGVADDIGDWIWPSLKVMLVGVEVDFSLQVGCAVRSGPFFAVLSGSLCAPD